METIITYLFRSTIWLTGFALVYFLFLQNERFFVLNRIYLVSGIVCAVIFPLFTWHYTVELPVVPIAEVLDTSIVGTAVVSEPFPIQTILLFIYLTGAAYLLFRIFRQTAAVVRIIRKSEIHSFSSAKLIRTADYPASFSFFSFVFVNPSIDETETNEIVNHEQEHIRQRHWIDLLLFEMLCTIQWFNPVSWLYGRFIRQNHEYLADEAALQRSSNPAIYRAALLNQMFGGPVIQLSNSFNYSLNKKRFTMMKHTIKSPIRKLKLLLILPLMAGIFYAFAAPEYKFVQVSSNSEALSQTKDGKTVTGKVVNEDGKPLKGASIVVSGKPIGTITDANGNFKLEMPDDSPVVISYVGFGSQKVNPDFEKEMVITMEPMTVGIEAMGNDVSASQSLEIPNTALIIIDGKETTKAEMVKINPEIIEKIEVLKDQASIEKYGEKGKDGVILITLKTDDKTVTTQTFKVKANSSFNFMNQEGFGTQPLIVKDGVIVENQNVQNIPPGAIESIEVLKGESATILYGEKGKNGVILINTKKDVLASHNGTTEVKVSGYANDQKENSSNSGVKIRSTGTSKTPSKQAGDVFFIVEEMPEFQGGKDALRAFIKAAIQYPEIAKDNGIQGKVFVNFVVAKDGSVTDAKIMRGVDPSLDKEALRIVNNLPKWKPGKQHGQAVKVSYTVPVNFLLQEGNSSNENHAGSGDSGKPTFYIFEEMPQFPGGVEALRSFVSATMKYPTIALENGIQGQVTVKFIVDKTGRVTNARLYRGVDPSLDKEALRIVESMPEWKPGKQNGEAVDVAYEMPVNFKLPANYRPLSKEKLRTKSVAASVEYSTKPSVDQAVEAHQLIIVPNPATDKATITLKGSDPTNKLEVQVFDNNGKFIKRELENGPTFSLSVRNFKSGTYYVLVTDGAITGSGYLVINH